MTDTARSHSRDFVASLEKGLKVLLCFERKHSELNVTEVARLTGYDKLADRTSRAVGPHDGFAAGNSRRACRCKFG